MILAEDSKYISLNRSTAVALLVRLGISDIPYVLSSKDRRNLINYLCNILVLTTDETYEPVITIDIDNLQENIPECDEILKILSYYAI